MSRSEKLLNRQDYSRRRTPQDFPVSGGGAGDATGGNSCGCGGIVDKKYGTIAVANTCLKALPDYKIGAKTLSSAGGGIWTGSSFEVVWEKGSPDGLPGCDGSPPPPDVTKNLFHKVTVTNALPGGVLGEIIDVAGPTTVIKYKNRNGWMPNRGLVLDFEELLVCAPDWLAPCSLCFTPTLDSPTLALCDEQKLPVRTWASSFFLSYTHNFGAGNVTATVLSGTEIPQIGTCGWRQQETVEMSPGKPWTGRIDVGATFHGPGNSLLTIVVNISANVYVGTFSSGALFHVGRYQNTFPVGTSGRFDLPKTFNAANYTMPDCISLFA